MGLQQPRRGPRATHGQKLVNLNHEGTSDEQ
jgi:hypothetical protein